MLDRDGIGWDTSGSCNDGHSRYGAGDPARPLCLTLLEDNDTVTPELGIKWIRVTHRN